MKLGDYSPKSVHAQYQRQQLHQKLERFYKALEENNYMNPEVKRYCISIFEQARRLIEGERK